MLGSHEIKLTMEVSNPWDCHNSCCPLVFEVTMIGLYQLDKERLDTEQVNIGRSCWYATLVLIRFFFYNFVNILT